MDVVGHEDEGDQTIRMPDVGSLDALGKQGSAVVVDQ
jgi:hypothetical protein